MTQTVVEPPVLLINHGLSRSNLSVQDGTGLGKTKRSELVLEVKTEVGMYKRKAQNDSGVGDEHEDRCDMTVVLRWARTVISNGRRRTDIERKEYSIVDEQYLWKPNAKQV